MGKAQKYLAMIRISPNMAAKLYEPLMEFSENPIEGVTLEEAYQVFGRWDFAVLFDKELPQKVASQNLPTLKTERITGLRNNNSFQQHPITMVISAKCFLRQLPSS
ncbi:MAG: hypothetical protein ABSE15_02700 [Candidatus Bathyarchaeia archaeon]